MNLQTVGSEQDVHAINPVLHCGVAALHLDVESASLQQGQVGFLGVGCRALLTCRIGDDDEITVASGGHQDYIYTIAAASTTQASTESHTYTDCELTYACEVYDDTYEIWTTTSDPPIETCDSTGVTYGVDTSDASTFQPSLTR